MSRNLPNFLLDIFSSYSRQRKPKDITNPLKRKQEDMKLIRDTIINRMINEQNTHKPHNTYNIAAEFTSPLSNNDNININNENKHSNIQNNNHIINNSTSNYESAVNNTNLPGNKKKLTAAERNKLSQTSQYILTQNTNNDNDTNHYDNNLQTKISINDENKFNINPINIHTEQKQNIISPLSSAPNSVTPLSISLNSNNNKYSNSIANNINSKPICPYGSSCYRKNPQHFIDLFHPTDSRDKINNESESHSNTYSKKTAINPLIVKKTNKKINYNEKDDYSESEESNTYDREFIASDDDIDWDNSKSKNKNKIGKNPNKKQRSKRNRRGIRKWENSDDQEEGSETNSNSGSDSEYIPTKDELFEDNEDEEMDNISQSDDNNNNNNSNSDSKPLCEFGANCYRKNPDHIKNFRHVDKSTKQTHNKHDTNRNTNTIKRQKTQNLNSGINDNTNTSTNNKTNTNTSTNTNTNTSVNNTTPKFETNLSMKNNDTNNSYIDRNLSILDGGHNNNNNNTDIPSIFSGLEVYIHGHISDDNYKLINRFFPAFDGDLTESISPSTTHILTDQEFDLDPELVEIAQKFQQLVFVRSAWAIDSIKQKKLLPEKNYIINTH